MEVVLATGFGHYVDIINGEVDELAETCASIFGYTRENTLRNITILYCKRSFTRKKIFLTIISIFFPVNFPFIRGYLRNKAMKTPIGVGIINAEAKVKGFVKQRLDNAESVNKVRICAEILCRSCVL